MKGKLLFVAGAGVGYVLGARAGRKRYEQIRTNAKKVWDDPKVQRQVDNAAGFVKEHTPDVAHAVVGGAKKVVGTVTGGKKDSSSGSTPSSASTTSYPTMDPASPEPNGSGTSR
ncbi:YtxH domain-containing protein [Clavibacter sp. VKM Ac-2872]|uniref:YtxH domain-containing protein n=1 Tax=Clavibacter sp. VKM Ac-2872 TaxID=2783812 RepID=UPI001889CE27|nr:YtxH domain-containing protein [Clavibacter sp. VKM Ac-2872]MBF4623151.1 YtxH domain-containing protein [Clavibacter sp. VKM Ac-2872]